jgi:hypothetical protein
MFVAVLPFAMVAVAQPADIGDLMLPSPVRMSGIVVDAQGTPIPDVWVWHHGDRSGVKTANDGHFEFRTNAPVVVFRKPGLSSVAVRTANRTDFKIAMQPAQPMRMCRSGDHCFSISGFGGRLCVPAVSGVKATKQGNDIDYGARAYVIETAHGKKGIRHGAGPMWTLGAPSDDRVWGSSEYSEITYETGGAYVVDARGKMRDGKVWRYVGTVGESLEYRGVEPGDAVRLDEVLDGVCLASSNRQPAVGCRRVRCR